MNHLPQWNRLSQGTTKVRASYLQPPLKLIFMDKENNNTFET